MFAVMRNIRQRGVEELEQSRAVACLVNSKTELS